MIEFLESTAAKVTIMLAIIVALMVIGIYSIARVRSKLTATGPDSSNLLTNFRELHAKGELSDEEFRTIKSMLGERMQKELELRNNGQET